LKISDARSQINEFQKKALKPYEDIAEGMEANFTQHLLQEMKKTVPKDTPDSGPMDYYNSLLDTERAQIMAKSESGLGIKKIILDQIVPAHLKSKGQNISTTAYQGLKAQEKSDE
jgi:Rod binding domain-containing protein